MFRTALISLVLASSATAALAQNEFDVDQPITVRYTDLDINTPAGATALVGRIDLASRKACDGMFLNRFDLQQVRVFDECRKASMTRAINEVNNPQVYAAAHMPHNEQLVRR